MKIATIHVTTISEAISIMSQWICQGYSVEIKADNDKYILTIRR